MALTKASPLISLGGLLLTSVLFLIYLNRKCDRSHTHAPCSGQPTKNTEDYTPEIARAFHPCFKADVAKAPFVRASAACCPALNSNVLVLPFDLNVGQGKTNPTAALCRRGPSALTPMADSSMSGQVVYSSTRLGRSSQGDIAPELRSDLRTEMNISVSANGYLFHWFRLCCENC
eukprot:2178921-Heterocapsa_arctica.AAC.1